MLIRQERNDVVWIFRSRRIYIRRNENNDQLVVLSMEKVQGRDGRAHPLLFLETNIRGLGSALFNLGQFLESLCEVPVPLVSVLSVPG